MNKFSIFIAVLFCSLASSLVAQIDISEARSMDLGQEVSVEGVVTNGSELGIIRYIQDGTGAIAVYPGSGSVGDFPSEVSRGDRIMVRGTLKEFSGLLEIDPVMEYTIISSGNSLPEPLEIGAEEINESNEAKLLTVKNAKFDDGGSVFGVGNYGFTANGESSEIYVRSNHPLVGEEIPLANVDLIGIGSQFNSIYQLLPRDSDDIKVVDNFFLSSSPVQSNITQNGFTVSWSTNEDANSVVRYGTSMTLGEEVVNSVNNTDHSVDIDGLSPGEFYYVQVASSNGVSEVESQIYYFSTASESSGEMRVYFNHMVDGTYSNGSNALATSSVEVENVLIDYIENAENTIDISMYNSNRLRLIEALSAAHDRGVRVRMITDNGTANLALMNPAPEFRFIKGNSEGLMHNKFLIIDEGSVMDSWIITGSMNFTEQNIGMDYNNMIAIQDQALCKAYRLEFEEMWGSDGDDPGIFNVKFGADKIDNTPHKFNVNGVEVESYFSPSDNTTAAIAEELELADSELFFALLTFTHNTLGGSVLDAFERGVEVRGIIDNTSDTGTEYDFLSDRGVDVTGDSNSNQTHHKYCIIDANTPNSDPVVITGSHNWSGSAETRNDENTLIVHDANVANIFLQEFEARWCEIQGGSPCVTAVEEIYNDIIDLKLSPNPVQDALNFELELDEMSDMRFELYDMYGRLCFAKLMNNQIGLIREDLDLSSFADGSYVLVVRMDGKILSERFIKQ